MAETSPQPLPTVQKFDVGGVLGRGLSISLGNIVPFGLLALIVFSPMFLYELLVTSGGMGASALSQILTTVLQWLLNAVATAALIYGTFRVLRNDPTTLGAYLSHGFALVFPIAGVLILFSLAVGIGMVLLFVPGLFLYTIFWVAIPAAVIERPGVIASFKRSMELTKGNRWRVFGLILVIFIGYFVLLGIIAAIFGMSAFTAAQAGSAPLGFLIIKWVLLAFVAVLFAVYQAVSYHDLRIAKEGGTVDQIAAVFD